MKSIFYLSISGSNFFKQDFVSQEAIAVRIFLKIFCNFTTAIYLGDGVFIIFQYTFVFYLIFTGQTVEGERLRLKQLCLLAG